MKNLLYILCFFCLNANATTYYVSTSGSDGNNGTSTSTPWATLSHAQSTATAAGSIIALKKGDTWVLNNVFEITNGGSSGNYITWDGSLWGSGSNAVIQANIDGANSPVYYSTIHIANCQYVILQNIILDGNNKKRWGIVIGGDNAVYGPTAQNNESYITIQDSKVMNCGTGVYYCHDILAQTWNTDISHITVQRDTTDGASAQCIAFYLGRPDLGATAHELTFGYIGYNYITNMGTSGTLGSGIIINNKVTAPLIERNVIRLGGSGSSGSLGISVSNNPGTADSNYFPTGVIIRFNDIQMQAACIYVENGQAKSVTAYCNKLYSASASSSGAIAIVTSAAPSYAGASFNFYNNTIVTGGTSLAGIRDYTNIAGRVTFRNNIVVDTASTGYGCFNILFPGSTIHDHNAYYRSVSGDLTYGLEGASTIKRSTAQAWEPTSIITDPLLTNLAGFDWSLQSGSPCIAAGIYVGLPFTGVAPNIGYYDFAPYSDYLLVHGNCQFR